MHDPPLTFRPATPEDEPFVTRLVPRFVEFGLPSGHDPARLQVSFHRTLNGALHRLPAGHAFYVAEQAGVSVGFILLEVRDDPLTGARHGHVSDLAVTPEADGRGVARALMIRAERWAYESSLPYLTLSVFATNARARALYAKLGYAEDLLRLHKTVAPDVASTF
nr:GNAT family N-acetyltransferase [Deinococcus pimensis]